LKHAYQERENPYRNMRFLVEIDAIVQAGFSAATIPDSTLGPIEYREDNDVPTNRKLPGLIRYGNLTLKWGITDSMNLYNWHKQVEQAKMKDSSRNLAVILMDEEGSPKSR